MKRIHSNTTEISHSPHKRIKVETQTTEVEYDSDATEIVEETDDETTTIIYVDSRIYLTKVQGFDDLSNTWSMSLQDIFHAVRPFAYVRPNFPEYQILTLQKGRTRVHATT